MSKLSSKNIAEAIYKASLGKTGSELNSILKRSALTIKDKRMLGKSKEIIQALQVLVDENTNTIRAKITTAKSLTEQERKKIEKEIKERYKGDIIVSEFFENQELLGGIRIEVGSEIIDSTYKGRLRKLEKFLIK